jgi:hypothetical protein
VNPGSLSATNLADASSGGGTVNTKGPLGETLIWAGAPNLGSVVWHVGLAASSPAPAGSDQVFAPPAGFSTTGVNVAYEASSGATFAAFYTRGGRPDFEGTYVGQIAPSFSGFTQVPGSWRAEGSNSVSRAAKVMVPLAARQQGGVFVAFLEPGGSESNATVNIREIKSGRTWTIAGSAGASNVSLSASPNGRVWVAYEVSDELYTAHTDPGAKDFGRPAKWGSPASGASIYNLAINGDDNGGHVAANAYANRAQNIWVTPVERNLTVVAPSNVSKGRSLQVTVLDGGAPVRGATVKVGNQTKKTGPKGTAQFKAPSGSSTKITAKAGGYREGSATVSIR